MKKRYENAIREILNAIDRIEHKESVHNSVKLLFRQDLHVMTCPECNSVAFYNANVDGGMVCSCGYRQDLKWDKLEYLNDKQSSVTYRELIVNYADQVNIYCDFIGNEDTTDSDSIVRTTQVCEIFTNADTTDNWDSVATHDDVMSVGDMVEERKLELSVNMIRSLRLELSAIAPIGDTILEVGNIRLVELCGKGEESVYYVIDIDTNKVMNVITDGIKSALTLFANVI